MYARVRHLISKCRRSRPSLSVNASEFTKQLEAKTITAGEMAEMFQIMTAVSKQVKMYTTCSTISSNG